ncbi:MAG: type III pantothenate kinase [Clostridia bacterium]|jgi:type III pantothenate kinase|nr:type III pantothenate kinase [Clostridia bacterium]
MILTIDIGNTNIVLGGFDDEKLRFISRISTNAKKTDAEYATKLKSILSLYGVDESEVSGAAISSVVPILTQTMANAIKIVFKVKAVIVGPGIKTGINLLADNPAQVGADLICACVAAAKLYTPPVLIIDMGTATKFMLVDESKSFTGVSIMPGVEISLKALTGGAAQLPQISLVPPKKLLGTNTIDCMRSGIIYGNAAMLDGMIDRIGDEVKSELTIVATGGLSRSIIPYCRHDVILDDDLILKGLLIIYNKNK